MQSLNGKRKRVAQNKNCSQSGSASSPQSKDAKPAAARRRKVAAKASSADAKKASSSLATKAQNNQVFKSSISDAKNIPTPKKRNHAKKRCDAFNKRSTSSSVLELKATPSMADAKAKNPTQNDDAAQSPKKMRHSAKTNGSQLLIGRSRVSSTSVSADMERAKSAASSPKKRTMVVHAEAKDIDTKPAAKVSKKTATRASLSNSSISALPHTRTSVQKLGSNSKPCPSPNKEIDAKAPSCQTIACAKSTALSEKHPDSKVSSLPQKRVKAKPATEAPKKNSAAIQISSLECTSPRNGQDSKPTATMNIEGSYAVSKICTSHAKIVDLESATTIPVASIKSMSHAKVVSSQKDIYEKSSTVTQTTGIAKNKEVMPLQNGHLTKALVFDCNLSSSQKKSTSSKSLIDFPVKRKTRASLSNVKVTPSPQTYQKAIKPSRRTRSSLSEVIKDIASKVNEEEHQKGTSKDIKSTAIITKQQQDYLVQEMDASSKEQTVCTERNNISIEQQPSKVKEQQSEIKQNRKSGHLRQKQTISELPLADIDDDDDDVKPQTKEQPKEDTSVKEQTQDSNPNSSINPEQAISNETVAANPTKSTLNKYVLTRDIVSKQQLKWGAFFKYDRYRRLGTFKTHDMAESAIDLLRAKLNEESYDDTESIDNLVQYIRCTVKGGKSTGSPSTKKRNIAEKPKVSSSHFDHSLGSIGKRTRLSLTPVGKRTRKSYSTRSTSLPASTLSSSSPKSR